MACVIVALSKEKENKMIKNLLVQGGYSEVFIHPSGAQAIAAADQLGEGVVICSFRLADMMYFELAESLPDSFKVLLLAPGNRLGERGMENIMSLSMPFQVHDLLNTIELMLGDFIYERRRKKQVPKKRTPEQEALIREAKALLMSRNNMSESEAHRYIQKRSMDESRSFVETAQIILTMR
ncbi:MAG: ANTAR domain-containing protein [Lachnospiraceae bacterium]|nr:ANTAR domain-containing protein [Lachnospiraceae bacterium]